MMRRQKRRSPEQIVRALQEGEVMLVGGKTMAEQPARGPNPRPVPSAAAPTDGPLSVAPDVAPNWGNGWQSRHDLANLEDSAPSGQNTKKPRKNRGFDEWAILDSNQ